MKTKLTLLSVFLAAAVAAVAAPLTATTAVHTKPDDSSPAITYLKAGTEPAVAHDSLANTAAGWLAIELPGPFEGYVANKDILKSLDVKTGAAIHLAPKPESGVLATFESGDKAEITGLHGKWTQVSLSKKLIGYIHLGMPHGYVPPAPTAASAPLAPAPVPTTAYGVTTAGRPAPVVGLNDGAGSSLPRLFQGKFVSTRSPFKPRRPYDWAVNDTSGTRYAYLDMSKLLLTEQIESYVNHEVVVYGAARPLPGGKDMVIEVESLQLR